MEIADAMIKVRNAAFSGQISIATVALFGEELVAFAALSPSVRRERRLLGDGIGDSQPSDWDAKVAAIHGPERRACSGRCGECGK